MSKKEYTTDDVVKALEICAKGNTADTCAVCPFVRYCYSSQVGEGIEAAALDLIKTQSVMIKALANGQKTLQQYIAGVRGETVKEFLDRAEARSVVMTRLDSGVADRAVSLEDLREIAVGFVH